MSKTIKELLEEVFDNRIEQIAEEEDESTNWASEYVRKQRERDMLRNRQNREAGANVPQSNPGLDLRRQRERDMLRNHQNREAGANVPQGHGSSSVSANANDRYAGEAEAKDFKALQDKRTSEFKTANPIMKPGTSQFNLRMGSKGESVTDLQNRLRTAGFDPGKSDGIFGAKTAAAVKAFQDANKLKVDSIAGNQTMSALRQSEGLKKIPSQVSAEIKGTPNPAANRPDAGGMSTPKKLNNSYDLNASLIDAFNDVVSSKHPNVFQEAKKKKLDEISKETVINYARKAKSQKDDEDAKDRSFSDAVDGTGKSPSKLSQKRKKGIDMAVDKVAGGAKVPATESGKKKLHPNQKQLDKNNNGELDSEDFRMLRNEEDTSKDYTTGVGKPEYSKEKPHYAYPNEHGATRGKKDDRENSSKHKKNSPLPTKEMINKEKMITASYNKEEVEQIDEMESIKVGDTVRPTEGPHKGHPHKVIHDFGDGHYNIAPIDLSPKQIKYRLGAARAHQSDLVLHNRNTYREEVDSLFSEEEEASIWGSEASLKAYNKKLQDKMVQKGLRDSLDTASAKVPGILSQVDKGTSAMRDAVEKYKVLDKYLEVTRGKRTENDNKFIRDLIRGTAHRGEKPIKENNDEFIFSEEELAYFEAMAVAPTPEEQAPNPTPKNKAEGRKGSGLSEAKGVGIANHPKPIPHQTRNMRSFGDIGLDNMVTLQHPETKEKVKVNVKHVHAFNKAYFGSSKPAEKEAHLKNFVEKVFGKGSSKSQVYSDKDKSVSLAGKKYGD